MQEYTVYVYSDSIEWYQNRQLHRVDGPAIEHNNGGKQWYQNGQLHRIDGPAVECRDGKQWYQNGQLHRIDGPAIEYSNGCKKWYIKGKEYTKKQFSTIVNKDNCDGRIVEIDGKKYKLNAIK